MKNRHLIYVDFSFRVVGFGIIVSSGGGLSILLGPLLVQFFPSRKATTL